jgi:hypothetical protein
MSGNVPEYVITHLSPWHDGAPYGLPWLGGQYDSTEWGLRCIAYGYDTRQVITSPWPGVGFRCCIDARAEAVAEPVVEDACPEDMVRIGDLPVCIDRYEASRGEGGIALSVAGAMPWVSIHLYDAREACIAAGKHLCGWQEWETACGEASISPYSETYPYGPTYEPDRCNGADLGVGAALPTGSLPGCEGEFAGLFDMSGNVREWMDSGSDCDAGYLDYCTVLGGSFSSTAEDLRCVSSPDHMTYPASVFEDLGFRCCRRL